MKAYRISLAVAVALALPGLALADTFSITVDSPSTVGTPLSGSDLLNPGPSVQVPDVLDVDDEVDALSGGIDAVRMSNIVYFSVDVFSAGLAQPWTPWDVSGQAGNGQVGGDLFATTDARGTFGVPSGRNRLSINQDQFGLAPLAWPGMVADGPQDELDAVNFGEFDLDGGGDLELPIFLSLRTGSPSLTGGVADSGADIVMVYPAATPSLYADQAVMGLELDDDIDALALRDNVNGLAEAGADMALFSLHPGSPTLTANGFSPADVFVTRFDGTYSRLYTADSLGLQFDDNVDALEVQIPEPGLMGVLALGVGMLLYRRRRTAH